MTTPVVGAAAKAVKGNRVPRGTLASRRRAAKNVAAPTTPALPTPEPESQPVTPAVTPSKNRAVSIPQMTVPQPVSSGAGFILALMAWTWVVIPFFNDGLPGVRAQLKAKFSNKAPDGSWLP